jgi:hypothetical protein
MKKYTVEIETLYAYVIEAESKEAAKWIARMNVADHTPPFNWETVSVVAEEIEPGNEPQIYRETPASIYKNLNQTNHL